VNKETNYNKNGHMPLVTYHGTFLAPK